MKNKELQMSSSYPAPMEDVTVATILMDRASGWSHNYYSHPEKTSYDLAVERAMTPVRVLAVALAAAIKAKKEAETLWKLKQANVDSLQEAAKKGGKEAIKAMANALKVLEEAEKALDEADRLEAYLDYEHELLKEDSGLHDLKIRQLMERYRNRTFRRLRNQLQIDGDVMAMRRGVTWVMDYTNSWLEDEAAPELEPEEGIEMEELD